MFFPMNSGEVESDHSRTMTPTIALEEPKSSVETEEDLSVEEDEQEDLEEGDEKQPVEDLPITFYCPISNQLLTDPVVIPSGETFERSCILERGDVPADKLYPNRALQDLIVRRTGVESDRPVGLKKLVGDTITAISDMWEDSEKRPLDDAFYCPITFDLIHVPFIDPEGNTFEGAAIRSWIRRNRTSPLTRNALELEDLYPNQTLGSLLAEDLSKLDEEQHPWISQWQQDVPIEDFEISTPRSTAGGTAAVSRRSIPMTQEEFDERRRRRELELKHTGGTVAIFALLMICAGVAALLLQPQPAAYLGLLAGCVFIANLYSGYFTFRELWGSESNARPEGEGSSSNTTATNAEGGTAANTAEETAANAD